eukprot:6014693-Pleurochrysis_carterae.AAC.1
MSGSVQRGEVQGEECRRGGLKRMVSNKREGGLLTAHFKASKWRFRFVTRAYVAGEGGGDTGVRGASFGVARRL